MKTRYGSLLSFDLELLKQVFFKETNIVRFFIVVCFCLLLLQQTWRNVSAWIELINKTERWVVRVCICIPIPPCIVPKFYQSVGILPPGF